MRLKAVPVVESCQGFEMGEVVVAVVVVAVVVVAGAGMALFVPVAFRQPADARTPRLHLSEL